VKVFLTGATGVMGTQAARALLCAGHEVGGLARTAAKAALLERRGVRPRVASLFDVDDLSEAFAGYDAVCNLATHVPVGMAATFPRAWRANDRIRVLGSQTVAAAAKQAGVRRLVQESVSFLYADGGDDWLDESSSLVVSRATEPAAEAETNAAAFACAHRQSVILRFGTVLGQAPLPCLPAADADGWAHLVHADDVGTAVVYALHAPTGVYNVGAEPVRRSELADVLSAAPDAVRAGRLPRMLSRLGRERLEPLTRSLRISSSRFADHTGWVPTHPTVTARWWHDVPVAA
jgi:nucleoside-diphosphate-sugar epimerase